jgi:ABC-type nitrate/sulfonate/bicarbonate transport system permease component
MKNDNSASVIRRIVSLLTKRNAMKIGSPIALICLWEIICRLGFVEPYLLPAPSIVIATLIRLLVNGELLPHIVASLSRALSGFVQGSVLGILVGVLVARFRIVGDMADIPLQALRAVPTAALVPLIIVWFGLGEASKVLIVAVPCFFLTLINTMTGVRNMDALVIKAARLLGAKERHILFRVIIPSAAPMIFAGLRLGVTVSLVLLIIAEMVASDRGLGFYILESQRFWSVEKMFAAIVTMSLLGLALDRIVLLVGNRLLVWRKGKTLGS